MKGCKYWDQMKDLGWVQTRSAIESIIHDHNLEVSPLLPGNPDMSKGRFWLETCGTHSSVNALEAIGRAGGRKSSGYWDGRRPDILALFMNDPRNDADLMRIEQNFKPTGLGNEYAKLYPYSVFNVFGFEPEYRQFHDWDTMVKLVSIGRAVQVCLINPGHFVTIVAYNELDDSMVFVDPWPDRIPDRKWWSVKMTKEEYNGNVKPYGIIF